MNLCPMCKKHESIIIDRTAKGYYKGKYVDYEETVFFCSTLGEDDPDAYFVPPKVMDKNLLRLMQAYEKLYPMSKSDIAYKKKLENVVNKKK